MPALREEGAVVARRRRGDGCVARGQGWELVGELVVRDMARTGGPSSASSHNSTITATGDYKPVSMQYTLGQNPPSISAADPRAKKSETNDVGTTYATHSDDS
ncbi:hypothetical protein QVD17_14828 [Tagetes erecta]|uniref:Uncharacterized protein n=1 Tax=Tagetes erecta TaxID=13708 RepID=A0AAD8KNS3_TARER|nr:hypothetical protein QVD17_14828 [Tagetes erecta]